MSEESGVRSFFNFRNVLPGYTFILIFISLNIGNLISLISDMVTQGILTSNVLTLIGIALGFFTFLGGAAFGFLVSQFWHLLSHSIIYGICKKYQWKPFDELDKIVNEISIKLSREEKIAINNYVGNYLAINHTAIRAYWERRWNLMDIIGSTFISVLIGIVFSFIFKQMVSYPPFSSIYIHWKGLCNTLTVLYILLAICLAVSLRRVRNEFRGMTLLMIRKFKDNLKEDLEAFYKKQETKNDSSKSMTKNNDKEK